MAAFATEVLLNVSDGCPMSLDVPVDTVRNEGSYDHQDDEEGEDYQADVQGRTKCLVKNGVYQTIICVSGINFGVEVKV